MPKFLIQVCHTAFAATCSIPPDLWTTAARCNTARGAWRRYREELSHVRHDNGSSWSGHVRVLDSRGRVVPADVVRIEATEQLREYQVAYVANDGSWDVVRTFWSSSDREAMEYAEFEYPEDDGIYVLRDGRNINGGAY